MKETIEESNETPINPAQLPDPISANRNGKIAKLSRRTREELNQRLQEGQSGPVILEWLNADPHAREILEEHFEGRPFNLQNLSEWRQGGYREWQNMQPLLNAAKTLKQRDYELWDVHRERFGNELANVFAVHLFVALEKRLAEAANTEEYWVRLCEGLQQINTLRRTDFQAVRTNILEREWEHNGYSMRGMGMGMGMSLGRTSGGEARGVSSDMAQLNAAREVMDYLMKAGPKSEPKSGFIKPDQTKSNSAPQPDLRKNPETAPADHTQVAAEGSPAVSHEVADRIPAAGDRPTLPESGSGPDESGSIKPNQTESRCAQALHIKPSGRDGDDPDNQTPESSKSPGEVANEAGSAPVDMWSPNKPGDTGPAGRMLYLELIT